jgi:hypothetical protein
MKGTFPAAVLWVAIARHITFGNRPPLVSWKTLVGFLAGRVVSFQRQQSARTSMSSTFLSSTTLVLRKHFQCPTEDGFGRWSRSAGLNKLKQLRFELVSVFNDPIVVVRIRNKYTSQ